MIQPAFGQAAESFWLPLPPTYGEFISQIRKGLELSEENDPNLIVSIQGARVKPSFYDVIQNGDVCVVSLHPGASSSVASASTPNSPVHHPSPGQGGEDADGQNDEEGADDDEENVEEGEDGQDNSKSADAGAEDEDTEEELAPPPSKRPKHLEQPTQAPKVRTWG